MKSKLIKSILAIIQVIALLQIAGSFMGPSIWRGDHSDLQGNIFRGGDVAVEQCKWAAAQASTAFTGWGVGFAVAILILASIGLYFESKSKQI